MLKFAKIFALSFITLGPAGAFAHPLYLSGTVGKAPVLLMVQEEQGKLSGWYVYLRVGKQIRMEGKREADGAFTLNEFTQPKEQMTGTFTGKMTQGHWAGTWRKPGDGADVAFALDENRQTLSGLSGDVRCSAKKTDRQFGYTYSYSLDLRAAKGAVRKIDISQRAAAKDGDDQGCFIGLDALKQTASDAGILLRTGEEDDDTAKRCSVRLIGAGDYLYVAIGDTTEGTGIDCRGGDGEMYCSPRSFWTDLIVDRKSRTCKPVE